MNEKNSNTIEALLDFSLSFSYENTNNINQLLEACISVCIELGHNDPAEAEMLTSLISTDVAELKELIIANYH